MAAESEWLNCGFVKRMRMGLPWVRVKLAMSLDGRTALASGESRWISGECARADVQRLRARSSAVLTGIGTVLADDPSLNVRLETAGGEVHQPVRVVLDSKLRMPATARLLGLPGTTFVLTAESDERRIAALTSDAVSVAVLPMRRDKRLSLTAVMRFLGEQDLNEVHVEAGPTVSGALLLDGLVDELVIYMAPHLLGDGARGLFTLPGLERMEQRIGLSIADIRAVGDDWRITATVTGR